MQETNMENTNQAQPHQNPRYTDAEGGVFPAELPAIGRGSLVHLA